MPEENKDKVPSVDELLEEFNKYKEDTTKQIEELKTRLESEKRKVASFSITGMTTKVEPKVEEVIEFDFDL